MNQELPSINGELLRLRRESRGWALNDLATRACMSIKQIRQLEEGGSSAFYSESVKWTSAKKVGSLLGMTPDEVFVQEASETAPQPHVEVASASSTELSHAPTFDAEIQSLTDAVTAAESPTSTDVAQTSKTPVLALAALFAAALAVAAWMRPEPEVVAEPAPPVLQNIAAEPNDAASVASAATVAASTTSAAAQPQKAASAATPATLTASMAASSASRASSAAASAASSVVVKPAVAVQVPAAVASAASKSL
jgi:transcriptional regulator with XRE-family HTH domain